MFLKLTDKKLLQNSKKLKGSNIFITEDYSKEELLQRRSMIKTHIKLRESGHSSIIKKHGLLIDGKYMPFSEIIKSETTSEEESEINVYDKELKIEKEKKRILTDVSNTPKIKRNQNQLGRKTETNEL